MAMEVLRQASPQQTYEAMVSPARAALPSGVGGEELALLTLRPRPVTVWFSEPLARVEVVAAVRDAQPHLRQAAPIVSLTPQSTQVAARVLGKVPATLSVSVAAVDGEVVLIDLARLADANGIAEALGMIASLLGHATRTERMVIATLHRDGMLAPATGVLDVSALPAAISAIAIAPGTRWQVSGRQVAVVEASDIYDAYAFITGQRLPQASPPSVGAPEGATTASPLARLAPLWPQVLTAAHDDASPIVRDLAMRSQAAARSSERARQRGAPDQASLWAAEALTLARAAQALADRATAATARAPREVVDEFRRATAIEDVAPSQRAEDASLDLAIARLRSATAPASYPARGTSAPHRGLAAQLARLHHLGQPASPAIIRWHQLALRYLALEGADVAVADRNADELHRVAALRLFALTMLLDGLIEQRLRELTPAAPAPDRR